MKRSTRSRARFGWRSLLICCLVLAPLSGCSSARPRPDEPAAGRARPVRPGAQGWTGPALELPANSPVVFWARGDRLLHALAGLRDWLFAEPAMFGADGAQTVGRARHEWAAMVSYLGMDPLSPKSWTKLGVDPSREIYVGAYPAAGTRRRSYVEAFEGALREALGVGKSTDVATAVGALNLADPKDIAEGVQAKAAAAVDGIEPIEGFRAVVPVADKATFLKNLDKMMHGAEYHRADLGADGRRDGYTRHFFYDTHGEWPGVMIRVGKELAIVDVISRQGQRQSGLDTEEDAQQAIRHRLERAIRSVDSGRPAAPRPPGTPAVGIAVDQQGAARFARLRGYHLAVERAQRAALAQRDAVFLQNVQMALASAANWSSASGKLSGVSYGLFAGAQTSGFFRLNITLFGARGQAPLAVSPAPLDLDIGQRGLGVALDLAPLSDPGWQRWIGVADPTDIVDHFAAADFDPALFALSFPRSLALLFANAEKVVEEREIAWLEPLLKHREQFRRLEIASAGIDVRGLRLRPRMVGLMVLDDAMGAGQRKDFARMMGTALRSAIAAKGHLNAAIKGKDTDTDAPDAPQADGPPLESDRLTALKHAPGDSPLFYYFGADADTPYLFFSYGLDRQSSQKELDGLSAHAASGKSDPRTVYARGEPVALLSLMTVFEPKLLDPLDASILAQRLGALVFSVEPEVIDGVQTIRYDLQLNKPPSLDEHAR